MKISKKFDLIVIENNIIPLKGYSYINILGIIFCHKGYTNKLSITTANHEKIHTEQQKEMLFIFFYIWYVVEWLIKLIKYHNSHKAYTLICFEKEAKLNQTDLEYITIRNHYSWLNYL